MLGDSNQNRRFATKKLGRGTSQDIEKLWKLLWLHIGLFPFPGIVTTRISTNTNLKRHFARKNGEFVGVWKPCFFPASVFFGDGESES